MVCSEFNCRPSEADEEDVGRCLDIVKMQRYLDARQMVEEAKASGTSDTKLPDSPMIETVVKVQYTLQKQAFSERKK